MRLKVCRGVCETVVGRHAEQLEADQGDNLVELSVVIED